MNGPRTPSRGAALPIACLGFLVSWSSTGPAFADWLVTRDGQLIETDGPWRVEGRQVVFESRSIPVSGKIPGSSATVFTLSLEEVDLARSMAETAARGGGQVESAALPVPEAAAPRTLLESWEDWRYNRRSSDRMEMVLKLGGAAWDNFLQAPASRPKQEVAATITEARLAWRLAAGLRSYLEASQIRYDVLASATAYGLGLRLGEARHAFQVGARLERDRRTPDLDDSGEAGSIVKYRAGYVGDSRALQWSLSGERLEQRFAGLPERESRRHWVRAGILYRGLGRSVVPEIGLAWAARDAFGENEDDRERTLQFGLRLRPARAVALVTRFESARRDFMVADSKARNFGREDKRRRWTLQGEVTLTRHFAVNVLYGRLEGRSTRSGRDFTAGSVAAGLTVMLGSTRSRPPVERSRGAAPGSGPAPAGASETGPGGAPPETEQP